MRVLSLFDGICCGHLVFSFLPDEYKIPEVDT